MSTILNLSEAVSIALHATVLLAARHGGVCSNRWIAETLEVSEAHLSKVLQRLHRVGLVESVRGPKGGFRLTRPPSRITLLQVYEAIEGPLRPATCLFRRSICDGDRCILGDCLKAASRDIKGHLSRTRLSELVDTFAAGGETA